MKRAALLRALLMGASPGAHAADQPGRFLLKPSDLPKPYLTPAVANNDVGVPRPPGAMPKAPKIPPKVRSRPVGIAVAKDGSLLVADDLGNVVWRVAYSGK